MFFISFINGLLATKNKACYISTDEMSIGLSMNLFTVRQNGSPRSTRAHDEATSNSSSISTNIPDLLNNLAWLAAVSQGTAVSSSQLTTVSIVRTPRRRTSSESSSCEETKITTTAAVTHGPNQVWNQVGVTPQKITDDPRSPLLTEVGVCRVFRL